MTSKLNKLTFTLRTIFVVVTVVAVWLGYQTNQARRQRIAVQSILSSGGHVQYDDQRSPVKATIGDDRPSRLKWMRRLLGDDYFRRVVAVDWNSKMDFTPEELRLLQDLPKLDTLNLNFSGVDDSDLSHLTGLGQLKKVQLEECNHVTDVGLSHVSRLSELEYLALLATNCTDEGVRRYLPKLPRLRYVDLAGIPITNDTALDLCKLKNLNFVHLGRVGHRAKHDLSGAVTVIKTTLPKCTVNYWAPESPQSQ